MATIKDLRHALEPHFGAADTVLRRLREVGLLPAGKPGRDGAGSAPITPRDAALTLLAACAWTEPVDTPAAATALADMRLRHAFNGREPTDDGEAMRASAPTVLDVLTGELQACSGAIANHQPAIWCISSARVVREGDPQDPHDPALHFTADEPTDEPLVVRQTILSGALLATVAALFRPIAPVAMTGVELDAGAAMLGMGRG